MFSVQPSLLNGSQQQKHHSVPVCVVMPMFIGLYNDRGEEVEPVGRGQWDASI